MQVIGVLNRASVRVVAMMFGAILGCASTLGCGSGAPAARAARLSVSGVAWPEADRLFHQDPRWMGADGASSIDLGGTRSLWLFGDTFVATTPANLRSQAALPRNTIAVQDGRDPVTATMRFFWGSDTAGKPTSFFASDSADTWAWPGGGIRLAEGPLVIFLSLERGTPGQGLGFASAGWRVAVVDAPDDDPSTWKPRLLAPPPSSFASAVVGSAVVRDGDYVVALAPDSETHAGYLARFRPADLLAGIVAPQWFVGGAAGAGGWVTESDLPGPPTTVIPDAGSEAGLRHDDVLASWIHVASRGFGKTTVAVRTAVSLTGPWTGPEDAFTPPESLRPKPFVYAAKLHAELVPPEPSEQVVTYASNSFTFADLLTAEGMASLYWPRFVRLTVRR
jgi:hypothetical protein